MFDNFYKYKFNFDYKFASMVSPFNVSKSLRLNILDWINYDPLLVLNCITSQNITKVDNLLIYLKKIIQ